MIRTILGAFVIVGYSVAYTTLTVVADGMAGLLTNTVQRFAQAYQRAVEMQRR
jgi:hypothetical protein